MTTLLLLWIALVVAYARALHVATLTSSGDPFGSGRREIDGHPARRESEGGFGAGAAKRHEGIPHFHRLHFAATPASTSVLATGAGFVHGGARRHSAAEAPRGIWAVAERSSGRGP